MSEYGFKPNEFDEEKIAKALKTNAESIVDPALGKGWHFQAQNKEMEKLGLSIDVFPESGVTRLTTSSVRGEIFNQPLPYLEGEEIVLSGQGKRDGEADFALNPHDGSVAFTYLVHPGTSEEDAIAAESLKPQEQQPAQPVTQTTETVQATSESPEASEPTENTEREAPGPESSAGGSTAAQETPPQAEKTEEAQTDKKAEAERVKLTGRLGVDPTFRETRTGSLVGRFPLAVHEASGETSWHNILAFSKLAENLRRRVDDGQLAKGQEVEIVGYVHEREQPTKDGEIKLVKEIYAAAVKRR